ncbi:hypothetical protein PIB30_046851 [Stylosanthes scabra]|uniref:DUF4283 domain-containing protein n=1 Tax=Stylosanthes scabra TaxID=79078 RepID=A0ABU6XEB3_9FABA|nr:hypothetical protein [Stylosanthes scabra]
MSLSTNHRDGDRNLSPPHDDEVVTLDATDVKENTEEFSKSLVGRIMADRSFRFGLIEGAFTAIWNYPEDLRIKLLGDNIYQFFFAKETDLLRIQLWDMPESCKTKGVATKIGEKIGSMTDLDLFEMRSKDVKIMKVKCNSATLRQSVHVALKWRTDLKADQVGWRVTESKENANPNWRRRTSSNNHASRKPTHVSLLKSFANLSCSEEGVIKNAEEEDSVSSVPNTLVPHGSLTAAQPSFQIGTTNGVVAKRNKRQNLKHLARRGGSGEAIQIQNVTGLKRTTTGAGLDTEVGNDLELEVSDAARGMGANPVMAPTTQ